MDIITAYNFMILDRDIKNIMYKLVDKSIQNLNLVLRQLYVPDNLDSIKVIPISDNTLLIKKQKDNIYDSFKISKQEISNNRFRKEIIKHVALAQNSTSI